MRDSMREELERTLRWTYDVSLYEQFKEKMPRFRKYKSRLFPEDVELLLKSSKLSLTRPRSAMRTFFIIEWAKKRRRPICWPDINQAIEKSNLGKSLIPLKSTVRKNGMKGKWSVQFDFKAWYDQLPLDEKVRRFFAFDGKHCLTTLPMGFRPACEVAQAISLALVDFELPEGVSVDVYIDNVRFVGDKDGAVKAGREFVRRCKSVNAKLDSEKATPKQCDTFLGEEYDYILKERRLGKKTVEKITFTHNELISEQLTYRQISAIFGLLFYSAEVLALPMCFLFDLMKWFRAKMSQATDNWTTVTDVPLIIQEELKFWLSKLEKNPWTKMYEEEEGEPDLTLTVDACETGWGCTSSSDTATQFYGAPWTFEDTLKHNLTSSVSSEPLGAWRAICRFVSVNHKKIVVYTDHKPQVWATKSGIAKAQTYNELMVQLKTYYPNTRFDFRFISGEENVLADLLSRFGKEIDTNPINA